MMSAEYNECNLKDIQTLYHIMDDLKEYEYSLRSTTEEINNMLRTLIKCGYYNRVSITFRCRIYETILFYQATENDLNTLIEEISVEITEKHVETLKKMATTANNLNISLRFTWKTDSYPEDFTEQRFMTLAHVYKEASTILSDLDNMEALAKQLSDYIGK